MRTLGVPETTLLNSGQLRRNGIRDGDRDARAGPRTDYAISVTGIAGPDGGTPEKPVGTVFIGYSDETGAKTLKLVLPGDRELIRWRSSQAALDYLRRQL